MANVVELHKNWMADPGYREAHAASAAEFALARELIAARVGAGLTVRPVHLEATPRCSDPHRHRANECHTHRQPLPSSGAVPVSPQKGEDTKPRER
jgi:hypothetical protein